MIYLIILFRPHLLLTQLFEKITEFWLNTTEMYKQFTSVKVAKISQKVSNIKKIA